MPNARRGALGVQAQPSFSEVTRPEHGQLAIIRWPTGQFLWGAFVTGGARTEDAGMSLQSLLASLVAGLLLGVPLAAGQATSTTVPAPDDICQYIPWWPGCF